MIREIGAALGALAFLVACRGSSRPSGAAPSAAGSVAAAPSAPSTAFAVDSEPAASPVRYVAIGGGATPESTEVSIEQDVTLLERVLPGPGAVLFAGGPSSRSVREIDPGPRRESLVRALGELFHPRSGRGSRYREPSVGTARATLENVEKWLGRAVKTGTEPLLVYFAAHGDQGESPRENAIVLWGGVALTPTHLAELTEGASRPIRIVSTSCYSGGFAELAFERADERKGPTRVTRCGLFSGPWDRQTSGCDANPDRRAQESYGLHFIHALVREDRTGRPLSPVDVDYDGDGTVSLLEAHTRARIASRSLDVPTTTSERWLRSVEHGRSPLDQKLLPEEQAVVRLLGSAVGLTDEASVSKRAAELEEKLNALDEELEGAQKALDERTAVLSSRLLERWPVLDDAYHPEFGATIERERDLIESALTRSPEAGRRNEAERRVEGIEAELDGIELEEARIARLVRAYETLHAAAALSKRGGEPWKRYAALLECERGTP